MKRIKDKDNKTYPEQGENIGRRIKIHHKNGEDLGKGIIIRDDIEEPYETIFETENGEILLSSECTFQFCKDRLAPTLFYNPELEYSEKQKYVITSEMQRNKELLAIETINGEEWHVMDVLLRAFKELDLFEFITNVDSEIINLNIIFGSYKEDSIKAIKSFVSELKNEKISIDYK